VNLFLNVTGFVVINLQWLDRILVDLNIALMYACIKFSALFYDIKK